MKAIAKFYRSCVASGSNFPVTALRALFYLLVHKKKIIVHHRVRIRGLQNITTKGLLRIGLDRVGFIRRSTTTYLNVRGKLNFEADFSIAKGCRFDIGPHAVVNIGSGGYINPESTFIIMHALTIGDDCAISWNCLFLDEDFHSVDYPGRKNVSHEIVIGNHVWIGCGASIFKGTVIPDNCVIAAHAVVRGVFTEPNALIGGNPARVLKTGVTWK